MMKAMQVVLVYFGAVISSGFAAGMVAAAETHVISTERIAWTYKDRKSTTAQPILVDDLQKGDVVDIKID